MRDGPAPEAAHRRGWQIFEVVVGLPFLVGVGLQWGLPGSFPPALLTPYLRLAGAGLICTGLLLVILARRQFARQGQPTDPGQPTGALVTSGVFAISRNPLYLGGICLLGGLALAANLPWALGMLLPALLACHSLLIVPEESYLAARFGQEYAAYRATVRRWLGRRRPARPDPSGK